VYGNGPADNRSFFPSLSANGGTLLIQSAASDLVGHDFNQSTDLFALARLLYVWTIAAGSGGSPTLAWFARPGENYHVQYKTTLSDSGWQEVSAPVTIIGGTARVTDGEPASSQRFYRVVAF